MVKMILKGNCKDYILQVQTRVTQGSNLDDKKVSRCRDSPWYRRVSGVNFKPLLEED